MPRSKKSRTDYRANDVDQLYTPEHIRHIAISGGLLEPNLEDLDRHIRSAAKAYLDLVDEEVEKQKTRKRQARKREKRAKKGLKVDIVDGTTLHVRKPGRPKETSMRAFTSSLALIYHRHSGREPKGGSERRPDDHFMNFSGPLAIHFSILSLRHTSILSVGTKANGK